MRVKRNRLCRVFLKSSSVSFFPHTLFFLCPCITVHSHFFYDTVKESQQNFVVHFKCWSAVAYDICRMLGYGYGCSCSILSVFYAYDICQLLFSVTRYILLIIYISIWFQFLATFASFTAAAAIRLYKSLRSRYICGDGGCCFQYLSYKPLIPSTNTSSVNVTLINVYFGGECIRASSTDLLLVASTCIRSISLFNWFQCTRFLHECTKQSSYTNDTNDTNNRPQWKATVLV